ncbi:MAG: hypothetical protein QY321_01040 [Patescibacteria group bacterium]|nr:MAG: hypothetical protein QY321_01040 [Patescibacteria group bacterium]
MKLKIPNQQLEATPFSILRLAGYSYIQSRRTGQGSFVRSFGVSAYPRFHIYVDENENETVVNLHLDQKQPSYQGSSAHSGEYDGPVVEKEMIRLKKFFVKQDKYTEKKDHYPQMPPAPSLNDERSDRWSKMLRNQ